MPAKQTPGKARSNKQTPGKARSKPSKTPKATASKPSAMKDRSAPAQRSAAQAGPTKVRVRAIKRPTDEQIRVRAYEIYLARGQEPGDPDQDWQAAAKQLRA